MGTLERIQKQTISHWPSVSDTAQFTGLCPEDTIRMHSGAFPRGTIQPEASVLHRPKGHSMGHSMPALVGYAGVDGDPR